jgi:hypothetical protein
MADGDRATIDVGLGQIGSVSAAKADVAFPVT